MQEKIETELGFKDYLAILKRRGNLFVLIGAPVLTIAAALAFRLPPVYESFAVLLVEHAEVPDYLVRPTIEELPNERIRRITDRVLTEENLSTILAERNPYPELMRADPDEASREVRRNLITGPEDPELLPTLARTEATIAFRVGFSHSDPETAQAVARDLVSLYLSENQRARQELASATLEFLAAEARRLESQIAEKETELAAFKQQHAGRLPELSGMNLQLLDRTERDVASVESEIRNLRGRVSLIESELTQLSPYALVVDEQGNTILSAAERLKVLQRQYVQASAVYSQDHPDILRLKREIDALSAQTGMPGLDRSVLETTLAARLEELEAARERGLTDEHPDIVRLEMAVENLRAALAEAPRAPGRDRAVVAPPDNPIYVQRQVELQATRQELDAALQRREELRRRLADIEERLTATPEVEREFSTLTRGYEQLLAQYADVQTKQQQAQIALNLETENRGDRFSVLRSADLPRLPTRPNRIAILMLGFVLAFAAGAAGVAIAEVTDTTVRGARDVHALLEIPPLVMIPYIDNDADVRDRRRRRLAVALLIVAWIGTTALLVMPPAG